MKFNNTGEKIAAAACIGVESGVEYCNVSGKILAIDADTKS